MDVTRKSMIIDTHTTVLRLNKHFPPDNVLTNAEICVVLPSAVLAVYSVPHWCDVTLSIRTGYNKSSLNIFGVANTGIKIQTSTLFGTLKIF